MITVTFQEKIEILNQQARALMMMVKVVPDGFSKDMYIREGIKVCKMIVEMQKQIDSNKTKSFKLKLVS